MGATIGIIIGNLVETIGIIIGNLVETIGIIVMKSILWPDSKSPN